MIRELDEPINAIPIHYDTTANKQEMTCMESNEQLKKKLTDFLELLRQQNARQNIENLALTSDSWAVNSDRAALIQKKEA
jgi:hypothetical protein